MLFLLCALPFLSRMDNPYMVVIPLLAVVFACALSFATPPWAWAMVFAYAILCMYQAPFLFFAPLLLYDVFALSPYAAAPLLLPLIAHFNPASWHLSAATAAFSCVAAVLCQKGEKLEDMRSALLSLSDQARESAMRHALESRHQVEKQDYQVRLATLSERNRIARDIHDNVGHLLSRALLQTGALLYAPAMPPEAEQGLDQLKETLSGAMDSVRQSVHNLHDQSIDLYAQFKTLCDAFTLCPVILQYDVDDLADIAVKHCFLSVVKEALSNAAKHGKGVEIVRIRVCEHPALYQLDIRDDGKSAGAVTQTGLGLRSIEERVLALGGNVHFAHDDGFRVFVSIPKDAQGGTRA